MGTRRDQGLPSQPSSWKSWRRPIWPAPSPHVTPGSSWHRRRGWTCEWCRSGSRTAEQKTNEQGRTTVVRGRVWLGAPRGRTHLPTRPTKASVTHLVGMPHLLIKVHKVNFRHKVRWEGLFDCVYVWRYENTEKSNIDTPILILFLLYVLGLPFSLLCNIDVLCFTFIRKWKLYFCCCVSLDQ